jgi:hypothetical protein
MRSAILAPRRCTSVERMQRRDYGHMTTQVTFDDPGAYTKPFSITYTQTLTPTRT